MAKILIIEDEQDLATLLEYNLKADGHTVEIVCTGAAGVARIKIFKPDLILLDLMLPDISGNDVSRFIRQDSSRRIPIIMVTARSEEGDRVKGLELGADDYVTKPFSVKELLLRIRAVLRRNEEAPRSEAHILKAGHICLNTDRHETRVNNETVMLTALEFRLLKTFLERPGRVQTRDTLLSDVWGIDADITTRTVDTHIKRLREKLGAAGDIIETIRGVGYKLVS